MSETVSRPAVASRPLRLAIAGMGLRGVSVAAAVPRWGLDVEIVALVDALRPRAELAAEYLGLAVPCFDDAAECLDAVRPDALAVFTPDAHHEAPAVAALRRDVHVYCEKPLAVTLEACDRICAAAERSGAVFCMGHNLRTAPLFRTVHDILAAGEIGEPLTVELSEYYHGGRTYFRRWNRLLAAGGGLWVTKSVHDFDMMCWLVGREPVGVCAVGGRKVFLPRPGAADRCRRCGLRDDCDDYQPPEPPALVEARGERDRAFWEQWARLGETAGYLPHDACLYRDDIETVEFGSAVVQFDGGACASYTMNCVTTPHLSGRWATVLGSKGALRADTPRGTVHLSFRGARPARTYDVTDLARGGHGGADERIFAAFVRACRRQQPPVADCRAGRRAVKLALAARQSMAEGRLVRLDD